MGKPQSETVGFLEENLDGDIGAPDINVMTGIRDIFLKEEPLVASYAWNDPIAKRALHIEFSDGIDSDWSRLDIMWYTSGAYRFHYVDENDRYWRFDRHPNTHSEEKHFHEPPTADSSTAGPSCILIEEPGLVTRAILKLWRRAVVTDSFDELNTAQNPP